MPKKNNINAKKDNKYNADNEIIIGVTTKPKEKVRVEKKKTTRTESKTNQKKTSKAKGKTGKGIVNKNSTQSNNKGIVKNIRNSNKKVTKEQQIKKINTKKMIISIFILLFIVLCGTIYYLTTPVFNIANIEVYGNEKNTIDTYISLSKINIGTTNIFGITENGIKNNLKENSYVEDITIERKFPNTLKISIVERKVAYQIKYSEQYIYLDNQGYILERSEEKSNVPFINGLVSIKGNINAGQRLAQEDLIKLNVVAKFINYCKYNAIENKITSIDVTDDTNYIVYFKEDKKTVYLGDASNLSERLSLLKIILNNEKEKEIEVFMNGNLNEDEVFIRYIEKKKGD